jgi:hypothetical protein
VEDLRTFGGDLLDLTFELKNRFSQAQGNSILLKHCRWFTFGSVKFTNLLRLPFNYPYANIYHDEISRIPRDDHHQRYVINMCCQRYPESLGIQMTQQSSENSGFSMHWKKSPKLTISKPSHSVVGIVQYGGVWSEYAVLLEEFAEKGSLETN